ncbi:MAG TPA: hypothetical protein VHC69_26770 [Polyangiaceae bacterium]|nr:hypothetical protein [Polyangiaceae bacterium]
MLVPKRGLLFAAVLSLATALRTSDARAADCVPRTSQSSCFDADPFHAPFAPSDFFGIPRGRAMADRTWSLGLDLTALHHPVVLHAPSPDPRGRDIDVVRDAFDGTLAVAGSPLRHLELGAALPLAFYRTGTGLSGVTSQTGPDLPKAAFRDLRIGGGYDMFHAALRDRRTTISGIVRLDLSFPTGKASAFAGERSLVGEPAVDVEMRSGSLFGTFEERARLRQPVVFGGQELGTQWLTSLGFGWNVLAPDHLSLALEAFVAPYLAQPARTLPDGTRVEPGAVMPSEWMFSVRSHLDAFLFGIGFGTAIPLSSEKRIAPSGTDSNESYAAVTSPAYRFAFTLRYAPPETAAR